MFVINKVRVLGSGPYTPNQIWMGIPSPPLPPGVSHYYQKRLLTLLDPVRGFLLFFEFQTLSVSPPTRTETLYPTVVQWLGARWVEPLPGFWLAPRWHLRTAIYHHHHQSLFIHEIVSFYMVFLGIVFKTRLKYSKELLTIMLKIQKLTLWIIRVTMGQGVLEKSIPWYEVLKTFKLGSFLISEGILFHRTDPLLWINLSNRPLTMQLFTQAVHLVEVHRW